VRRFLLYFLAANLIGGFFLWLAARELPFAEVSSALAAGGSQLVLASLAFVVVYAICHACRLFRWYDLVAPLGEVEPWTAHRVCAVGLTAILLLPLRLGELVRPYLLSRRTELPLSSLLGVTVVERVLDGLLVTGLLFATLATYGGPEEASFARAAGWVAAAVFVPAAFVCVAALFRRHAVLRLLRRIGHAIAAACSPSVATKSAMPRMVKYWKLPAIAGPAGIMIPTTSTARTVAISQGPTSKPNPKRARTHIDSAFVAQ
jgi:hypothetical protein